LCEIESDNLLTILKLSFGGRPTAFLISMMIPFCVSLSYKYTDVCLQLLIKKCDNKHMILTYHQIGFADDDKTRVQVHYTVRQILWRLRNYNDNGPIPMDGPKKFIPVADSESGRKTKEIIETLEKHKILLFRHADKSPALLFEIFVTNRYKLELLLAEAKWLGELEEKRSEAPEIDNLVYYDLESGRGLVNGNPVFLRGRNKKVFKPLFNAAPNPVDKESLKGPVATDHKDDSLKYATQDAFNLLRKACKVDKTVISLGQDGGRLHAKVFPLSVQLFEDTFSTEEKQ